MGGVRVGNGCYIGANTCIDRGALDDTVIGNGCRIGPGTLIDLSLVLFIGILVGAYSSIFIASPVVLWWSNRKGQSIRDVVLASAAKEEALSAAP